MFTNKILEYTIYRMFNNKIRGAQIMKKEGKVDILTILVGSVFIFLIYAFMVFGGSGTKDDQNVNATYPFNTTTASATTSVNPEGLNSSLFNSASPQFACDVTANTTGNITNVTLYLDTTLESVDSGTPNQTQNSTATTGGLATHFFNLTAMGDGVYYWFCHVSNNGTAGGDDGTVMNTTGNRTLIIDNTAPFLLNVSNTTANGSVLATGGVFYLSANFSDSMTNISAVILYANTTGAANNEVNITALAYGNQTLANLSFVIPASEVGTVINFTLQANDSVNNINSNASFTISVDGDGTVPGPFVIESPVDGFNTTSEASPSFKFSVLDNNDTSLNCAINVSMGGSNYTQKTGLSVTNGTNYTTTITDTFSNGTFHWNITCADGPGNFNTSVAFNFTVDQVGPNVNYLNFTNVSSFNTTIVDGDNARAKEYGNSDNTGLQQGQTIYGTANFTENLTLVVGGRLQALNISDNTWVTLNQSINDTTGYKPYEYDNWVNLSYGIPTGHNMFEGRNVTFRIIANDSVNNVNISNIPNITIQINDTTVPEISFSGDLVVNGTNTSDVRPQIVWNVTEFSTLAELNVSIDGDTTDASGCGKFIRYVGATGTPNDPSAHRNETLDIGVSGSCGLANGSHGVEVSVQDDWGNIGLYSFNFTVEAGVVPNISLTGLENGLSAVNNSNVTPYTGINITAVNGEAGALRNYSWTSSCNPSVTIVSANGGDFQANNVTFIYPFNYTGCKAREANQSVFVTVSDVAGNTDTQKFTFAVDDLGPRITVHNPVNNEKSSDNLDINVSAFDGMNKVDTISYFLDGEDTILNHTINGSTLTDIQGQNVTFVNASFNFTPGTHTLKIRVNDTRGVVTNSSLITITQTGPIELASLNATLEDYISSVHNYSLDVEFKIRNTVGDYISAGNISDADQIYEVVLSLNNSDNDGSGINVSLKDINGSAVNWDKFNFSVVVNDTLYESQVENNYTADLLQFVLFNNDSLEEFADSNDYFGVVVLPLNISDETSTVQEIWWFENESDHTTGSRTNISQCTADFTRTTGTPCWNYSSGGNTTVFVPHFSAVGGVNDTINPWVNVTTPRNESPVSMFRPNITVSSDAVSCTYITNGSLTPGINQSMTLSENICLGQTERFINTETTNGYYDMNFTVTDSRGNVNNYVFWFNVSDIVAPNVPGVASVAVATSSATVNLVAMNESVNATILYGTTITDQSSIKNDNTFNSTKAILISGLTASTTYQYNVSVCDYNGNCVQNGTYNFTTGEAEATTTTTAASSSSNGDSGSAGAVTSNIVSSAKKSWNVVSPDIPATMTISKSDIGITEIHVSVTEAASGVELKVEGLKNNPRSSEPANKIFQYIEIRKTNLDNDIIDEGTIKFKVPKTWLSSNNVAEDKVLLFRYTGKWEELVTKKVSSTSTNAYYEATTPGFSTFAIGAQSIAAVTTTTTTVASESTTTTTTVPAMVEPPKKKGKLGIFIILGILAAIIVAFVALKKRQNA